MDLITIEAIIFYVLLLDALACNLMALYGKKTYARHLRTVSRIFPAVDGWAAHYLILMLWIGTLLWQMGALGF